MLVSSTANDYDALDRFGRTLRQQWEETNGTPSTIDQVDYTYDYAGNRLTRDIPSSLYSSNDRDQTYAYDGLHRLQTYKEGVLTNGSVTGQHRWYEYNLDQLGNWETFGIEASIYEDEYTETRTHNEANELATSSIFTDPVHDAAGNMTTIAQPAASVEDDPNLAYTLRYDAWNRLVKVTDGTSDVQINEYDGLNRRIVRDETGGSGDKRHFYYNQQWQVLVESVEVAAVETADCMYSYHSYYVDAVAARMRASDSHVYLHDGNFNVTGVVDVEDMVIERYAYTPYGEVEVFNENFSPVIGNTSTIDNEYLYTGRRLDPVTGLQLNRHRFYASHLGRWVSQDIIKYDGGMNLYGYVLSKPTILLDPSGLAPISVVDPTPGVIPTPIKPTPTPIYPNPDPGPIFVPGLPIVEIPIEGIGIPITGGEEFNPNEGPSNPIDLGAPIVYDSPLTTILENPPIIYDSPWECPSFPCLVRGEDGELWTYYQRPIVLPPDIPDYLGDDTKVQVFTFIVSLLSLRPKRPPRCPNRNSPPPPNKYEERPVDYYDHTFEKPDTGVPIDYANPGGKDPHEIIPSLPPKPITNPRPKPGKPETWSDLD